MQTADFFSDRSDPFSGSTKTVLDVQLLDQLRAGAAPGRDDLEVAVALAQLVHEELEAYGTGYNHQLTDDGSARVIRTLHAVLKRLEMDIDLQFRNFATFKNHWIEQDCANSYQARRSLLAKLFEPLYARLYAAEDHALSLTLAEPVSPRTTTGWSKVDEEIRELKRRFRQAESAQDYRAVGLQCVGVLEALSRTLYDPAKHLRPGETEPAPDKTKLRIGRYIEDAVPGPENAEIRGVATKVVELSQAIKHRETPTRRDAGVAADAVILLANILRRLDD